MCPLFALTFLLVSSRARRFQRVTPLKPPRTKQEYSKSKQVIHPHLTPPGRARLRVGKVKEGIKEGKETNLLQSRVGILGINITKPPYLGPKFRI